MASQLNRQATLYLACFHRFVKKLSIISRFHLILHCLIYSKSDCPGDTKNMSTLLEEVPILSKNVVQELALAFELGEIMAAIG